MIFLFFLKKNQIIKNKYKLIKKGNFDYFKEDVFSLGVVLYQMITLDDTYEFLNGENNAYV